MKEAEMEVALSKPASLLVVEDDAGMATLLSDTLADAGHVCRCVGTGKEALELFSAQHCDLALLDYGLPDMSGHELITAARARGRLPPFIVLTGHGDERLAVELMKSGARDYLVKDTNLLHRLPGAVARVLLELSVKRRLEEAEQALRHSEAELSAIHDHAPLMMVLLDGERRIRRLNRAALEFAGAEKPHPPEWLAALLGCVHEAAAPGSCGRGPHCATCDFHCAFKTTLNHGLPQKRVQVSVTRGLGRETRELTMLMSTARLEFDGQILLLLCLEDITEQKRLETQLRQAQKMEAVGQLAGGVAHDFNNILTGMMLHLGLLQNSPLLPPGMQEPLRELEGQAQRAAALTRQLLLFSRRQVMQTSPLDLRQLLDNMLKMLRRLLGETIAIEFAPPPALPLVQADAGMLEQVVMNLCVNARDAMPQGGRLIMALQEAEISPQEAQRNSEARPGRFVRLCVTDTGCGMNEKTLVRIFEPFFTTKEPGKGTGLGLATVFSIVKQHQGCVTVSSAPGVGSTFCVYWPVSTAQNSAESSPQAPAHASGGTESILLVEDEQSVRDLTARALRNRGYRVLEAANGPEALRVWEQSGQRIDLLFSDVVMPQGLSGLDLARQLRVRKPDLKVILFSGYSNEAIAADRGLGKEMAYLSKPCSQETMVKTVRDCLDAKES
jgi:signal transduction histidine kinase/DNA-binding response OmpR family regulator